MREQGYAEERVCTLHAQRGARNGRLCPQRGSVCVSGRYRFLSIDSPVNTAPLSISNVTASSLLLRLLRNTRIYRESLDGTQMDVQFTRVLYTAFFFSSRVNIRQERGIFYHSFLPSVRFLFDRGEKGMRNFVQGIFFLNFSYRSLIKFINGKEEYFDLLDYQFFFFQPSK